MKKALKLFLAFVMVFNTCAVATAAVHDNYDQDPAAIEDELDQEELANAIIVPLGDINAEAAIETFSIADIGVPGVDNPDAYWDRRHSYAEIEQLSKTLADTYPDLIKRYSIGHTWRENMIWCMEMTSPVGDRASKIPVALIGNIHGGEHEAGESTTYTGWWLATQYGKDARATRVLDEYIVYVVPVLNIDGWLHTELSGTSTRQNARPIDRNGDGVAFSDPYVDVTGDSFIGSLYRGTSDTTPPTANSANLIGRESKDFDNNGKTGDDPRYSDIDMNRTFDHMWHRYDVDTPNVGANTWTGAGPQAASEPEVRAIQNFLIAHPVYALIAAHTGIQCVLYPWCWTREPSPDDAFFATTARAMADAYESKTVPGHGAFATFYTMCSNRDYPTSSEMIDWAYGRLGVHAYTVEVYNPSNSTTPGANTWGAVPAPAATWQYVGQMYSNNGRVLLGDNVWCYTTGAQQVTGRVAPRDQHVMCEGFREAALTMFFSEPHGDGPKVPDYLKWEAGLWY